MSDSNLIREITLNLLYLIDPGGRRVAALSLKSHYASDRFPWTEFHKVGTSAGLSAIPLGWRGA